jgi:hypothetical protein
MEKILKYELKGYYRVYHNKNYNLVGYTPTRFDEKRPFDLYTFYITFDDNLHDKESEKEMIRSQTYQFGIKDYDERKYGAVMAQALDRYETTCQVVSEALNAGKKYRLRQNVSAVEDLSEQQLIGYLLELETDRIQDFSELNVDGAIELYRDGLSSTEIVRVE